MEANEYKLMYELEAEHWWYKGLHDLLFSTIQKIFSKQQKINVLDAGCGTGFVLKHLEKYGTSFGVDVSEIALEYCQKRGLNRIIRASTSLLPFPNDSFDLVISTDVLYHKAVKNDEQAINEVFRVLKKGGHLLINLPAYNYLWRAHDDRVHTRHRYTKREVRHKLKKSKFKIIKISYRNSFLFPVLLLFKLFGIKSYTNSDLKPMFAPLNFLLYTALKIENLLLRNINMPFGTSIFCMAKK